MLRRLLFKRSPKFGSNYIEKLNEGWIVHSKYYFSPSKSKIFKCPEPGEGTTEVDILEWNVKPGDKVEALQQIGSAKYEKADIDILAPYDGIIHKLLVDAGDIAIANEPLVEFRFSDDIDDDGDTNESSAPHTTTPPKLTTITQTQTSNTDDVKAAPSARHLARNNNIDITSIEGTGSHGHVTREDVQKIIDTGVISPKTPTISTPTTTQTPSKPSVTIIQKDDYVKKIIGAPRAMVKKMTEANKVPQFGYSDEICMDELIRIRSLVKDEILEKYNLKVSYLPFIIKAVSLALLEQPTLNAHIDEECTELTVKSSHNIGIAVDTSTGLMVPNIKNVQNKSILDITQDLTDLSQRARNSQITQDDITGGTFTISNIGAIGGTYCKPIVFVPEVCIGALGKTQIVPKFNNNNEVIKSNVMAAAWSADHRIIDGATVARFSNSWKDFIEDPIKMMLFLQ